MYVRMHVCFASDQVCLYKYVCMIQWIHIHTPYTHHTHCDFFPKYDIEWCISVHIYIHACIHTCVYGFEWCICMHTYTHTFRYLPRNIWLCEIIHTRSYIPTYTHTYIHTYIQTDRQTDRQTGIQTDRQTEGSYLMDPSESVCSCPIARRTCEFMCIYVHTWMHMCIYVCIYMSVRVCVYTQ